MPPGCPEQPQAGVSAEQTWKRARVTRLIKSAFYATNGSMKQSVKMGKSVNGSKAGRGGNAGQRHFPGQHLVNTMQKITPIFLHFPALAHNGS